jgi:MoaA/NifB/PqqE/SkfB family radical SAM enzyme
MEMQRAGENVSAEEILGKKDRFYNRLLNRSLLVFFREIARAGLMNTGQGVRIGKVVWNQFRASRRRKKFRRKGIPVPPIMIYSVTHRCNLKCRGCYSQALPRDGEADMPVSRVETLFEEAHDMGISFIVLAGGEPLMRPEILEMLVRYPDTLYLVFTNGLLLDEACMGLLSRNRHIVPVISLEGHETETDVRRGEGVFRHLEKRIQELQKRNIFFSVSFTVTRSNIGEITEPSLLKELTDNGCRLFFYLEYTPIREGTESWVPGPEERERFRTALDKLRHDFPGVYIAIPEDEEKFGGCLSAGRGFVHISAGGRVEPCPFAPFSDTSIRDISLSEALVSPLLTVIRKHSEYLEEGGGGCALWARRDEVQRLLHEHGVEKKEAESRMKRVPGVR